MYVQRALSRFVEQASAQFPVLLVTGARQVGKTTLLRHVAGQGRAYVTLDDPLVLDLARRDPALFLQRYPAPALIDEIQYAPELLPHIKMIADQERRPGLFWLTGSQQFHLMRGVSESLAGRVAVVQLLGLSRREQEGLALDGPFLPTPEVVAQRLATGGALPLRELYRTIWRGSFPAVALRPEADAALFFSSYLQTYLQRDVRDLAQVGDEMAFLRFLRAAAARTGQILNIAALARDADVAPNTAKRWLSILQASGLVHLLEPYHSNLTKRLTKAPKLHFLDTGLCAHLTGWSSPETLEAGAMSGAMLETWIFAEILKSWRHSGREGRFFFYRDKDQVEIDLLLEQDGTLYPLEFKKTAAPGRDAARGFRTLERLGRPVGPGGVVCLARESVPLTDTAAAIPASAL
jgi:predicted AAA+ superfamily ATPase